MLNRFNHLQPVRFIILLTVLLSSVVNPKSVSALVFTASGTFRYVNESGGFSFVKNARVEIYVNGAFVASTSTSATDGSFATPVNFNGNNFSVYAVAVASRSNGRIVVTNAAASPVTYNLATSSASCNSCTSVSLGVTTISGESDKRAFFIFDKLQSSQEALSQSPINWTQPENVSAVYPSSANSSYLPSSNKIQIFGNPGVTYGDGFAASPIIHEYGHAVMELVYVNYPNVPTCNPHGFDDISNPPCAWTEGWANYFQAWMRGVSNYVFASNAAVEFETLTASRPLGPASESAVTATLWDIYDSTATNEPWDQLSIGAGPIWDVFKNGTKPDAIGKFQKDWVANSSQATYARKVAINFCAHQAANGCVAVPFVKK